MKFPGPDRISYNMIGGIIRSHRFVSLILLMRNDVKTRVVVEKS